METNGYITYDDNDDKPAASEGSDKAFSFASSGTAAKPIAQPPDQAQAAQPATSTSPQTQRTPPKDSGGKGAPSTTGNTALDTLAQHFASMTPPPSGARDQIAAGVQRANAPKPAYSAGKAPAHYTAGPTGYAGFGQVYGANAGAAERAAREMLGRVRSDAQGAYGALQDRYGDFEKEVGKAATNATRTGTYEGPNGLDTTGLDDQFSQAGDELAALGMGAGGMQALSQGGGGRGMGRLGAGLVAAAASPEVSRLQNDYGDIETAVGSAGAQAQQYAADREARAKAAYDAGVAEQQRLVDAERSRWIYDQNGRIVGERGGPTAGADADAGLVQTTAAGEDTGERAPEGHWDENWVWHQ